MVCFTCEKDRIFVVKHFDKEHYHEMVMHYEKHLLRSIRSVSKSNGSVLESMVNSRIPITNAYDYMADESGGMEHVGFIETDAYNYLHEFKAVQIEVGDSQNLVNYFKKKANEEGLFL